jgi:hypothetical protein
MPGHERKEPFCNIPVHGSYCDAHPQNTEQIVSHGVDIALFTGGMRVLKYMLAGIGATILFLAGIGFSQVNSKFDQLTMSLETNAKATELFMMTSSNDRTAIKARIDELGRDIQEIKTRLKMN